MVCFTQKPNFLAHSCCSVEVVNGAPGERFESFFILSLSTNHRDVEWDSSIVSFLVFPSFIFVISSMRVASIFWASSLLLSFFTFPSTFENWAEKLADSNSNFTEIFQLSTGLKFCISLSFLSYQSIKESSCLLRVYEF